MTTLSDIVELQLVPAGHGRWTHFRVVSVARNGTRSNQPAVNTVDQARRRVADWFPNAELTVQTH